MTTTTNKEITTMQDTTPGGWHATSPTITNLAAALVETQAQLGNVTKTNTANAGQYAYSYADLGSVLAYARPVLAAHGLAITQTAEVDGDDVLVWTTLLHASGEFLMARPIRLPAGKTVQQTGSAVTYGRRYALLALLSIGTEDDDGATAAPRTDTPRTATPRPAQRSLEQPAANPPEPRTDAEREMRAILSDLPTAEAKALRQAFRVAFGSTLAELPPDRHNVALDWLQQRTEALS